MPVGVEEECVCLVAMSEEFTWSQVDGVTDTRPRWEENRIVDVQLSWGSTEIIWLSGAKLTLLG